MKNKIIIGIIAVALLFGCGGFFAGLQYKKYSSTPSEFASDRMMTGGERFAGPSGGRNLSSSGIVFGEILSFDAGIATIKLRDGGSKIVFYSSSTEIGKFVNGIPSDLEIGKTVTVSGKANSDGSITAQSIQLRPQLPQPLP